MEFFVPGIQKDVGHALDPYASHIDPSSVRLVHRNFEGLFKTQADAVEQLKVGYRSWCIFIPYSSCRRVSVAVLSRGCSK